MPKYKLIQKGYCGSSFTFRLNSVSIKSNQRNSEQFFIVDGSTRFRYANEKGNVNDDTIFFFCRMHIDVLHIHLSKMVGSFFFFLFSFGLSVHQFLFLFCLCHRISLKKRNAKVVNLKKNNNNNEKKKKQKRNENIHGINE